MRALPRARVCVLRVNEAFFVCVCLSVLSLYVCVCVCVCKINYIFYEYAREMLTYYLLTQGRFI
jgi:hypothetical protein